MSQKEITRSNLIEAFWELYKEKPLAKITVKEITDKAGYNRGTFYTYFSDTYEVQKLLRDNLIPTRDIILGPLMMFDKGCGNILDTLERTNDYVRENSDKIAVMIGPEGDPSFIHEFKMKIRAIIMDYVYERGVSEPEKVEYIIEYQLSALIGIFQLWIEKNEALDEDVLATLIEEVSHKGVTTMMETMLNNKEQSF